MRFLSLFSGIEAASAAWLPLGWQCAATVEIEPFPSTVLRHHYPDVPNLGDIIQITEAQIAALGRIDLIVGGFPCQDVSVAGLRKGFNHTDGSVTRSGLFHEAIRLVHFARKHCGLRWLVVENVPGLLSNNNGCDFATVVGEMVGTGFDVPRDGWESAGCALGPIGMVEWNCLDAQFFGLAQRRNRVFLVADFGDWRNRSPVLLEPASLRGDPPPCRQEGKGVAPTISSRPTGGGGLGTDFDLDGGLIAHALSASRGQACAHAADLETYIPVAYGGNNTAGPIDIATAVNAHGGPHGRLDFESETFISHSLRGEGHDASEDGTGRGVPLTVVNVQASQSGVRLNDTAGTLDANYGTRRHNGVLSFHQNQRAEVTTNDTAGALNSGGGKPGQGYSAAMTNQGVRRLMPIECERLQGFPDNWTNVPYRGRPAADGNRYRALGNSMAVPVMAWIGRRIAAVDIGS